MTNDEFYERVAGRLGVDPVDLEVAITTEETLSKVRDLLNEKEVGVIERAGGAMSGHGTPFQRRCIFAAARHIDMRGLVSTEEEVGRLLSPPDPAAVDLRIVFEVVVSDDKCIAFVMTRGEIERLLAAGGVFV